MVIIMLININYLTFLKDFMYWVVDILSESFTSKFRASIIALFEAVKFSSR